MKDIIQSNSGVTHKNGVKGDHAGGKHKGVKEGINAPSQQTIVQPKLELTTPGDSYEREADRMADFVMRKAYSGLPTEMPSTSSVLPPLISRRASSSTSGVAVDKATESGIHASRGGGHPMPTALRSQMESGFETDFSGVRLHTGSAAEAMSNDLSAKAFTYGNDIYFNRGQYSPDTTAGQHLIAHELTHVVQQSGKIGREDIINQDLTKELINSFTNPNEPSRDPSEIPKRCSEIIKKLKSGTPPEKDKLKEELKENIRTYKDIVKDTISANSKKLQAAINDFYTLIKDNEKDSIGLALEFVTTGLSLIALIPEATIPATVLSAIISGGQAIRNYNSVNECPPPESQEVTDKIKNVNINLDMVLRDALVDIINNEKYEKAEKFIKDHPLISIETNKILHEILVQYAKKNNTNTTGNRIYFDQKKGEYASKRVSFIKRRRTTKRFYLETDTSDSYFVTKKLNEYKDKKDYLFNENRIKYHKTAIKDNIFFNTKLNEYYFFSDTRTSNYSSLHLNVDIEYLGTNAIKIGEEHNIKLHKKLIVKAKENPDIFFDPKTRKYKSLSFFEPSFCEQLNILIEMSGNIQGDEDYNKLLHKQLILKAKENPDIFFDPEEQKYRINYKNILTPSEVKELNNIIKVDKIIDEDRNFNNDARMKMLKEYYEYISDPFASVPDPVGLGY